MASELGPFVVQCDKCRTIIGDSYSLVCMVEHPQRALALCDVQAVNIEKMQNGSQAIVCAHQHCEATLGEIPLGRLEAEGKYLVHLRATMTYMLGSAAGVSNGYQAPSPSPAAAGAKQAPDSAVQQQQQQQLHDGLSELRGEIHRLQQMVIIHHSKIEQLEEQLEDERRDARNDPLPAKNDQRGASDKQPVPKRGRRVH
ncbi:hypothetical protein T492DRAFT_934595 [Pavlovales sp. CCMP2436]|nr:hypothetical protein T492DRAFT_934595 [Pavlovales sp. CCMP2436]